MTPGILVFLVGLYVLPLGLLIWGHRHRRLSPRSRRAFWGAILGHCIAGTVAMIVGMVEPQEWTAGDTLRGFLGLWSLLVFPLIGALGAWVSAPARS